MECVGQKKNNSNQFQKDNFVFMLLYISSEWIITHKIARRGLLWLRLQLNNYAKSKQIRAKRLLPKPQSPDGWLSHQEPLRVTKTISLSHSPRHKWSIREFLAFLTNLKKKLLLLLKFLRKEGRSRGAEKHQDFSESQSVAKRKLLLLGGSRWQNMRTS